MLGKHGRKRSGDYAERFCLKHTKFKRRSAFPLQIFLNLDSDWVDDVEHLNYEEQLTPEDRELKQEEEQEEAESWEGL